MRKTSDSVRDTLSHREEVPRFDTQSETDRLTLGDQSRHPQLHIVDVQRLADVLVAAAAAAVQIPERGPQIVRHILPGPISSPERLPDDPLSLSRCGQPTLPGHIGAMISSARAANLLLCQRITFLKFLKITY